MESGHPHKVVSRTGEVGAELRAEHPDEACPPEPSRRLGPAEDFLHPLAHPLARPVAVAGRDP